VKSNWVYSALRPPMTYCASPGWLWWRRNWVEWLAGETEVLGENLLQCRFVHHKPHMLPGREPGRCGGKPVSKRLSYGTTPWWEVNNITGIFQVSKSRGSYWCRRPSIDALWQLYWKIAARQFPLPLFMFQDFNILCTVSITYHHATGNLLNELN
jgi:hypothetical protein